MKYNEKLYLSNMSWKHTGCPDLQQLVPRHRSKLKENKKLNKSQIEESKLSNE